MFDPRALGIPNAPLWERLADEHARTGDVDVAMQHVADTAPDTRAIALVDPGRR